MLNQELIKVYIKHSLLKNANEFGKSYQGDVGVDWLQNE